MYSVVGTDGQTYGPVNPADLQNWINEGRINASTEVIDAVTGDRKKLSDISMTTGLTFPVATPPSAMPTVNAPATQRPSDQYAGFSPQQTFTRQQQSTTSSKSKALAAVLAFFLGGLGVHRYYLGHTSTGTAMLCMTIGGYACFFMAAMFAPLALVGLAVLGCVGLWGFVDFIMILIGSLTDVSGRPLS